MIQNDQLYLLKKLRELIDAYKRVNDKEVQSYYLDRIASLVSTVASILENLDNYLLYEMQKIILDAKIYDILELYMLEKDFEYLDTCKQYQDDYDYIKEIINKINISENINLKDKSSIVIADYYIKDYLKNNKLLLNKYAKTRDNMIFDENFNNCAAISIGQEDIIFANTYDITALFHEFLHCIYPDTYNIYYETNSILGELALQNKYNINSSANRLLLVKCIKEDNLINVDNLPYIVGTILSYTLINKYGSDFKDIYHIMNLIYDNRKLDFLSMLNVCDLKEQDIINSFNTNKSKIYRKR